MGGLIRTSEDDIHMYTYVRIHTYIHTGTGGLIRTSEYEIHMYTYLFTYLHVYTHIHTHIHAYTQVSVVGARVQL